MPRKALVVDPDPTRTARIAESLRIRGFDVTEAPTFERAVAAAGTASFDAVVTAVRLGAYNGLHLIVRTKDPGTIAIVTTTDPDPVLEAEALRFGAICLVAPWNDPAELVEHLARHRAIEPN